MITSRRAIKGGRTPLDGTGKLAFFTSVDAFTCSFELKGRDAFIELINTSYEDFTSVRSDMVVRAREWHYKGKPYIDVCIGHFVVQLSIVIRFLEF